MQNNLDELQSLIAFLRIKPYNDLKIWKDQITQPMKAGKGEVAMRRLQFYLKAFMKRRTKDVLKKEGALNPDGKAVADGGLSTGFKITERKIENISAEFPPGERAFYSRLEGRMGKNIDAMMKHQKMNYASALTMLLRLRQACNHPKLVGGDMAQDREALTTGQITNSQTPRKAKVIEQEMDDLADLMGGVSVETKSCNMCSIELTTEQAKAGTLRCTDCEADYAAQTRKASSKSRKSKSKKHHPETKVEPKSRKSQAAKNRKIVLDDSDEEEAGDWVVPEYQRQVSCLGRAGGSDDENAEGGGESLASSDTETGDESSLQILGSHKRKPTTLVETDEEDGGSSSSDAELESASDEESGSGDDSPVAEIPITSAKTEHLIKILNAESSSHKFIVFSQFTSMLNLVEPFLTRNRLRFTRYDGSMRNDAREASLERLRNDSKTRILLCSLKCGSLGLNLTAASRVVILEPFWNPFVEEQAIDRVHRLNQTRDVVVYKLTVKDTVEARILDLQEKKRALAEAAIEGKQAVGKLSMKDILALFRRDAEHAYPSNGAAGNRGLDSDSRRMFPAGSEQLSASRSQDRKAEKSVRRTSPEENSVYGRRW